MLETERLSDFDPILDPYGYITAASRTLASVFTATEYSNFPPPHTMNAGVLNHSMSIPCGSTLLAQPKPTTKHLLDFPDKIPVIFLDQMSGVPRQTQRNTKGLLGVANTPPQALISLMLLLYHIELVSIYLGLARL
jgi:hypothetical protein